MIQTVAFLLTTFGLQKALTDHLLNGTGQTYKGLLNGSYWGLFTAWPGWTLSLTAAQITEATYAGYARVAAVWSAQGIDPVSRPEVYSQNILWVPTGGTTPNQILGMALFDAAAAGNLLGVGRLPAPVSLATTADMLSTVARFQMPLDPANWGQYAAVN